MVMLSQSFAANWPVAYLSRRYADLVAGIVRRFGTNRASTALVDSTADVHTTQLIAQTLPESHDLDLDWPQHAAKMTGYAQRRYWLRRAIEINYDSEHGSTYPR